MAPDDRLLDTAFFDRDTRDVAHDLIGVELEFDGAAGRIVETEAYRGDPASHFVTRRHKGRMMGDTYARLYIYRIYGVHHCLNVTTESDGPGAVLIRALEPVRGVDAMRARRPGRRDRELASGPAKLFVALGLSTDLHGGPFDAGLTWRAPTTAPDIATTPRIGISKAKELPWRFVERGNPHVSRAPRG